jgi:hypothetical protein
MRTVAAIAAFQATEVQGANALVHRRFFFNPHASLDAVLVVQ